MKKWAGIKIETLSVLGTLGRRVENRI